MTGDQYQTEGDVEDEQRAYWRAAPMADDHDTLLARADTWPSVRPAGRLIADLAAALRESHANYHAALNVIRRLDDEWTPILSIKDGQGHRMLARFWRRGGRTETMTPVERDVVEEARRVAER